MKGSRTCVVGMLGAVASGKSAAARLIADCARARGWEALVVDADSIGHRVLLLPEVGEKLRREFGDEICDPDGAVSRERLAQAVFAAPERLEKLNAIVHPVIVDTIAGRIRDAGRDRPSGEGAATAAGTLLVLDAPLLMETGLDERYCDLLVFVDADAQSRGRRAQQERGWEPAELARRDRAQIPPERKRQRADFVINNNGAESDLRRSVESVTDQILAAWRATQGR